jgi:hypothetical protein
MSMRSAQVTLVIIPAESSLPLTQSISRIASSMLIAAL